MILATIYVILFAGHFDAVIVDQVSVCVPLLWLSRRKTIFYCHFPDKLLCVERKNPLKKLYRFFLDFLEEFCLLFSNIILVNSKYTLSIYKQSFPLLVKYQKNDPLILYPSIELDKFDKTAADPEKFNEKFFLSLNRYERKKNVALAIRAFEIFLQENPKTETRLIIAGGYDPQLNENIEHYEELRKLATELKI